MLGSQLLGQHPTGTLRHGLITIGAHIHRGVVGLRPSADRDVRLGKQGEACHPVGLDVLANKMEQRCTSTGFVVGDSGSEKSFIVEPGAFAIVGLESAIFAVRIGDGNVEIVVRCNVGIGGFEGAPSGVGTEVGEGVAYLGPSGES